MYDNSRGTVEHRLICTSVCASENQINSLNLQGEGDLEDVDFCSSWAPTGERRYLNIGLTEMMLSSIRIGSAHDAYSRFIELSAN